jgi:hypothetical protein
MRNVDFDDVIQAVKVLADYDGLAAGLKKSYTNHVWLEDLS